MSPSATAALGSFFAGTVATFLLAVLSPRRSPTFALEFGPADYFSPDGAGPGRLRRPWPTARSLKALAMVVLGLLLGVIGTDIYTGLPRFTFDRPELADGIELRGARHGPVRPG